MHEMGIALEIIRIATESIPAELKGARVERVHLQVGQLSAVVSESLRFCFKIVSQDTALDGTELFIEEMPVIAKCRDCQRSWTITGPVFICESCQGGHLDIMSGRQLDIKSIEIAQKDEDHDT